MSCDSKISVIIPVYNVEKYIDECFESILAQEHSNFEVIMVDDGSTEASASVCDYYTLKDDRFQVIHTVNHGIAAARNLAMAFMTGSYCFYLDPDDVIEPDSLRYLVELIERTDSDMSLAVTRQFIGKYTPVDKCAAVEQEYNNRKDIIEKVLFDKGDVKPLERKKEPQKVEYEFFSTLYRISQLRANDIRFIPVSYGEDTYVCFKSLLTSQKVVTSSKVVYSHRRNPTSTTFQYHPELIKETKAYYNYYIGLFRDYAPEYVLQAEEGLDGQYLYRCLTSIEGELYFSPTGKSVIKKIRNVGKIRNNKKFRKLFTFKSMEYTSGGTYRKVLISIKLGLYPVTVTLISLARKMRK